MWLSEELLTKLWTLTRYTLALEVYITSHNVTTDSLARPGLVYLMSSFPELD